MTEPEPEPEPEPMTECVHCGWPTATSAGIPHPDAEVDAESGELTAVICPSCWTGRCDCDEAHTAVCFACETRRHRDDEWYRTPDSVFGEWVCPDCGRRREKWLDHYTHDADPSGAGEKLPFRAVAAMKTRARRERGRDDRNDRDASE